MLLRNLFLIKVILLNGRSSEQFDTIIGMHMRIEISTFGKVDWRSSDCSNMANEDGVLASSLLGKFNELDHFISTFAKLQVSRKCICHWNCIFPNLVSIDGVEIGDNFKHLTHFCLCVNSSFQRTYQQTDDDSGWLMMTVNVSNRNLSFPCNTVPAACPPSKCRVRLRRRVVTDTFRSTRYVNARYRRICSANHQ